MGAGSSQPEVPGHWKFQVPKCKCSIDIQAEGCLKNIAKDLYYSDNTLESAITADTEPNPAEESFDVFQETC